MLFKGKTNLLKNSSFALIWLLLIFSHKRDESLNNGEIIPKNEITLKEIRQKQLLQRQIQVGFNKNSIIRLQKSTSDFREL